MQALYTPSQAAKQAGVSASSVRNYTAKYTEWFSPGATPAPGEPRQFSPEDVKLIAYISACSAQGLTHDEIKQRLKAGEIVDFEFSPNMEEEQPQARSAPQGEEQTGTQLAPQALLAFFSQQLETTQAQALAKEEALQKRLQQEQEEARAREEALQERLQEAQRTIGQLEGELKTVKEQPKGFWARLFGA